MTVVEPDRSRLAGGRPVPHLVTEVPGPRARAHVEFDHSVTSPSLPRAYPIVPVRGDGLVVEDIDGNLFLDLNKLVSASSGAGLVFLCNPNNPSSTVHTQSDVEQAVRAIIEIVARF